MSADYSIHYKRFHDDSEDHAVVMAEWLGVYLNEDLPKDRSAPALDIGCGFGFALRALRAAGFLNVRGIEISSQQAAVARRGGFEVSVVTDTVDYLKKHPGSFGVILLLDVLEHIPVPEQLEMMHTVIGASTSGFTRSLCSEGGATKADSVETVSSFASVGVRARSSVPPTAMLLNPLAGVAEIVGDA